MVKKGIVYGLFVVLMSMNMAVADTRELQELKREIEALRKEVSQLTEKVARLSGESSSARKVWACFLEPSFDPRRFVGTSPNKSAAIFEVVESCRRAGIDKFHCEESRAQCNND